jgi:gliding motility-associated-like protein
VFNRWGELIWESDNMEDSWDGTFQGEPVPNGVYAYRILVESYNEVVYEYLGSITLIR